MSSQTIKLAVCPMCGSNKIKQVTEDRTYKTRRQTIVVKNVPHEKCESCGEKFFDQASYEVINTLYKKKRKAG